MSILIDRERNREDRKEANRLAQRLEGALLEVRDTCTICWLHMDQPSTPHRPMKCHQFQPSQYFGWKKKLRFPVGTCYFCGVPQDDDLLAIHGSERGAGRCCHQDKMIPALYHAWQNPRIKTELCQHFGLGKEDDQAYLDWLGKKVFRSSMCQAVIAFVWLADRRKTILGFPGLQLTF